jgi:predicted RNA-binding Zn-ribbon protein involved in translation (DUF1610 family)
MNKRECQKYADCPLHIRPNDGLLCASQIGWLVRTDVKTIDHHRTLIIYFYPREQVAQGNFLPQWTVFQTAKDYITLEHRDDGSTAWRTAGVERLDQYGWLNGCAFVSLKDGERLKRSLKGCEGDGLSRLRNQQDKIQSVRRAKRQKKARHKIAVRMRCVPPVPSGLFKWMQRQVMPAYFFYEYKKGRKAVPGVCSACGENIELTGVKHNAKVLCPNCGRELTAKSFRRMGHLSDRETCQVVQKVGPDELVIRIFKFSHNYATHTKDFWESSHRFVHPTPKGGLACEEYYSSFGIWKKGNRPVFSRYQYNYAADNCGHLYCGNLSRALKDTPWQYCPVEQFYTHFREPMEMYSFLAAHLRHPKLEHLIKVGFFSLASDLAYRDYHDDTLDEAQNRTHRILGVAAEDVPFLRDLDADKAALRTFKQYSGLKDRQALLQWQLGHRVQRDMLQILKHITPHKLMHYMECCFCPSDPSEQEPYRTMQDAVSAYRDYLDMCEKLGYDLSNSFVLYPKHLQSAHDSAAERLRIKADAEMRQNFEAAYRQVMARLDFEHNGLKIVYPTAPEEIVAEGQALHHCVGSYVSRVANKECLILFLRHCDDTATPFYTIEVRDHKAVQVRGMRNTDPTPEVKQFMTAWEKAVLQAA